MSAIRLTQSSFAGGEIDPALSGRIDVKARATGARTLRNVLIEPTGGVVRRDGLAFLDRLPGPCRLVPFEIEPGRARLLVLLDVSLRIHVDGVLVASAAAPWTESQLDLVAWTQSGDTVLLFHPDVEPRRLVRVSDTEWRLDLLPFVDETGRDRRPFRRFAAEGVTMKPDATTGTVTLTAGAPHFVPGHVGAVVRLQGRQVRLTHVFGATIAVGEALQTLASTAATADWDESAWSDLRGWPAVGTFHQDRLVVAGTPSLPDRIWMSRIGRPFDFDRGTGLDDEAIELALRSDRVGAVRAIHAGRDLQLFTTGGEWLIQGDPLTPANVAVRPQTRVGSLVERFVPPCDVDGATLFAARGGREIREFLFTEAEQAYVATDLALLARHAVVDPLDMDWDPVRRLLFIAMADGSLGTLTLWRSEAIVGWSFQETDGAIRRVAVAGDRVYVAVERSLGHTLEVLEPGLPVDSALSGAAAPAAAVWAGLEHLNGKTVRVVADGVDVGTYPVVAGRITLDRVARFVTAGLAFAHEVEPMPPSLDGVGTEGLALRPLRTALRVIETPVVEIDLGTGPVTVTAPRMGTGFATDRPPAAFSGDLRVGHLGWRRAGDRPLWRIRQDVPMPFRLLSVSTDLKVSD